MTAFAAANLPTDIASVEELAAWCAYVLRETAPTQAIVEAVNTVNFQADLQESINPNGTPIFVARFCFEMLPVSSVTGKRWNAIKQIPQSANIPSYYTAA